MAVAVLRSVDGRVRPGWRFVIAAVLAILAQLAAFRLMSPPSLNSASAMVMFSVMLAIDLAIFTVLSRTIVRATSPLASRCWPTVGAPGCRKPAYAVRGRTPRVTFSRTS